VSDELVKLTRTLQIVARDIDAESMGSRERGFDLAAKEYAAEAAAVREAAALIESQAAEIAELERAMRELLCHVGNGSVLMRSEMIADADTCSSNMEHNEQIRDAIKEARAALAPASKETNDGR
jgi:hypothetical protein